MTSSDIKFRCSGLGYLMTEPKLKSEALSETAKTHLIDVFVSAKYNRREEITSKYLDKGNACEEDSITALSRVQKRMFNKNEEHLENDFIKGTPDIFIGESIKNAIETLDTKTSWSANTFFRVQKDAVDKMYYWQGQGYMWLTGAKKHTVAYCLVNGTEQAIIDEKRKLAYKMGVIDMTAKINLDYILKCRQIEINHIYDLKMFMNHNPGFELDNLIENWSYDIPLSERVFCFEFERNEDDILKLQNRITDCRAYMDKHLFKNELIEA